MTRYQEGHRRLGFPSVMELDSPALNGSSRLDLAFAPLPGVPYFKRILMTSLHAPFPRIHHESGAHTPVPAAASHGVARLTLFIGGKAYNVQPLDGDDVAIMKAFRLRKFDGTDYDIAQTAEGISCDCPDFTFRREAIDPSGCKHIKALIACGLIDPGQAKAQTVPPAEAPTPAPQAPAAPGHEPGNMATEVVPANGQPTTLLEIVEHEAMGYKAWGTPAGRFLADQLGRIAQLLRWSGANARRSRRSNGALRPRAARPPLRPRLPRRPRSRPPRGRVARIVHPGREVVLRSPPEPPLRKTRLVCPVLPGLRPWARTPQPPYARPGWFVRPRPPPRTPSQDQAGSSAQRPPPRSPPSGCGPAPSQGGRMLAQASLSPPCEGGRQPAPA